MFVKSWNNVSICSSPTLTSDFLFVFFYGNAKLLGKALNELSLTSSLVKIIAE